MNHGYKKIKRTAKSFIAHYLHRRLSFTSGMNIICFSDSITRCGHLKRADRWPHKLQQKLNEWKLGHCHVYNMGRNGDTSTEGLNRFSYQVLPHLPSLVLVQFGFNDAKVPPWASISLVSLKEYRRNLREIHRATLAHKGQCIFIVNHSIDTVKRLQGNNKSYSENFAPYNQAVREVAAELAAPSIDLPSAMEEHGISMKNLVNKDSLHLSQAGSCLYADIVFTALAPILLSDKTQVEGNPLALN